MDSALKPLQSRKALSKVRTLAQPTTVGPSELLGKHEAELQDKEQKSQENVTSTVISTHAKVPSGIFFFFLFSPLKFQIPVCGQSPAYLRI